MPSSAEILPLFHLNRIEQYFHVLYSQNMRLYPSRIKQKGATSPDRNRQWIFVGSKENMKSVATQSTLGAVINDESYKAEYYTPNGYYRRDKRLTENLRWLNAFVFDVDSEHETLLDMFDRITSCGLPLPTAVVQTPSGGFHITYILEQPVRATEKALRLYTAIMSYIAEDLGSDQAAVGANRIFRIPTENNLVYFMPEHTYSFELFKDWRNVNYPYKPHFQQDLRVTKSNLMNTAAVTQLLNSPCPEGYRDRTCFTLALAMKASKWPIDRAEDALLEWHSSYCSRTCKRVGKSVFSAADTIKKVRYVYNREKLIAPSAEAIQELSGELFRYAVSKIYEGPKAREERERSHYQERIQDLLELLKVEKVIFGSQSEIASRLNCPLSTFKEILERLASAGQIRVETKRGRGGNTTITLLESPNQETDDKEISVTQAPHSMSTVYHIDFLEKRLLGIQNINYQSSKSVAPDDSNTS